MATVITIGGSTVSTPRDVTPISMVPHSKRGCPTFTFSCRGGALPTGTDPYLGKEVTITINSTLRFTGDVVRRDITFQSGIGWLRTYQAAGLRNRGDKVPHTDSNNGSDSSSFNLMLDNHGADYLASRAGRTVGEILTEVLTMVANATGLDGYGIGSYTSLSPPTLPTATVDDLALLTIEPPAPVYFGGEKLLNAVEAFLGTWAPNHTLHVEPDGTLRFLDTRTYTPATLTLGTDPILPTPLSRDLTECFQRVVVRGQSIAEMFLFSTRFGTLLETPFAHDGLTIAQAKAAWTPDVFFQPSTASEGTCTCPDTTHVTIDPDNASDAWAADFWDQTATGKHGYLALTYDIGTAITTMAQRRVTANGALTAGGTCSLTLDRALPHLDYNKFVIRGLHASALSVWTEYALPAWAATKIAQQAAYPFPFRMASGDAVTMTSLPIGSVCWSTNHNPPWSEAATQISVDAGTGTVLFGYPTYLTAGSREPDDVRALVPIYTAVNQAISPADSGGLPQYTGTSHSAEALHDTLTVTVSAWRDPANHTAMLAFAADILDSVKDAIIEGTVTYLGLYEDALAPGLALNIAGAEYTTGWEAAALPVVEVQLTWHTSPNQPMSHTTTMRCSNRRAHFSDTAFLHPDRTGVVFDLAGTFDTTGLAANLPDFSGVLASGTPGGWQGGVFAPDLPLGNVLKPGSGPQLPDQARVEAIARGGNIPLPPRPARIDLAGDFPTKGAGEDTPA